MKVKAKKHLGQHFLTDQSVAMDIVDAVNSPVTKNILEVGPGMGVLTQYLLKKNLRTKVVEIDSESVEYLYANFLQLSSSVIEGDFLKMDLSEVYGGEEFILIGNFPYNISSQIMFKVLDYPMFVPQVVGMFQKEVAERMTADHGSKIYGILSVLLKIYYDTEYLFTVSENVFDPPPKVKSGVIRLTRKRDPNIDFDQILLKKIVKAGFNQRRKTLRNALRGLDLPDEVVQHRFMDLRAEQLSYLDFIELTKLSHR